MSTPLERLSCLGLVLGVVLTAPAGAQSEYRAEKISSVGIEISVSKRLKRLPPRLQGEVHLRARFRPQDSRDYVQTRSGPYEWYTDVYEFHTKKKGPITPGGKKDDEEEEEKPKPGEVDISELMKKKRLESMNKPTTFAEWVKEERNPVHYITEGKPVKKRGKYLPYKLWEFHCEAGGRSFGITLRRCTSSRVGRLHCWSGCH